MGKLIMDVLNWVVMPTIALCAVALVIADFVTYCSWLYIAKKRESQIAEIGDEGVHEE